MLSIRTIIWLSLIILLLPTDEQGKQALHQKAHAVVGYVKNICAKVDLCSNFDPSWNSFAAKARTGRDLIADLIAHGDAARHANPQARGSHFASRSYQPRPQSGDRSQNTLQISDLIPEWRSPSSRNYASR